MKSYSVRSIRRLALLAGLAAGFAACSGQPTEVTGPSASLSSPGSGTVVPFAGGGTPVRTFTAGIAPSPVNALSTRQYTVTINNNGSGSGNGAAILGVNIAVDSAFGTPAGLSAVENPGVTWSASFAAGVIHVVAPPSGELTPGETLVVSFTLVAPNQACGTSHKYDFTTTANKERDFSGVLFTLTGFQPSVTVNGPTCTVGGACSGQRGQGYWKTHASSWPVTSLTLGSRSYTKTELLSILNQPANPGNGLIILSYQLIAAKLNIANGSDPTGIASTIAAADLLIGGNVVPPVGADFVSPSTIEAVKDALEAYNEACTNQG
jgi:hypothetical protein